MNDKELQQEVWNLKARAQSWGLSFYPVEFDVISRQEMVEFGTYILPRRYHHWTFGKFYGKLKQLQDLGALEILEMVLNADPAQAYLLDSNTDVEAKMVIAHVYGHVDFFKNNYWFKRTNKKMVAEAEYHEKRLRELESVHGKKAIEEFLDICISLQWHTDFYGQFGSGSGERLVMKRPLKLDIAELRELVIEPGNTGTQKTDSPAEDEPANDQDRHRGGDYTLTNDILQYLIENADLKPWQSEVLAIVREEMLYFMPNALTKIMNEGWATYWQERILKDYLDFADYDRFAIKHSEVLATPGLNPYRLGYLMYKEIEKRWDEKEGKGAGLEKIFYIRRYYDDIQFIREFLTQEICDDCGLYVYEKGSRISPAKVQSTGAEDIKMKLMSELINFGKPLIAAKQFETAPDEDLHLFHRYDGRELNIDHAADVLRALYRLWLRPVHLETIIRGDRSMITYDGDSQSIEKL